MPQRTRSTLHEILPAEERAIEAVVARYQRVAPAVTRFARTLAGNEALQVRLGSQSSAGEGEIVLDPGTFQTAYARSAPVTPTEVALTTALHEAIHLIATDFEERRPFPEEWLPHRRAGTPEADPEVETPTFFLLDALSEAGGEAAEALFLSIEDARQEAAYFSGYGGARSVLADLYRSSIGEALRDAPALGQYALSCFLLVGGYEDRDAVQRRVGTERRRRRRRRHGVPRGAVRSRRSVAGRRGRSPTARGGASPRSGDRGRRHHHHRPAARRRPGRSDRDQRHRRRPPHHQPAAA